MFSTKVLHILNTFIISAKVLRILNTFIILPIILRDSIEHESIRRYYRTRIWQSANDKRQSS